MTQGEMGLSVILFAFVAAFSSFHLLAGTRWFNPSPRTVRNVRGAGFFVLAVVSVYGLLTVLRG
jgi:phosphoglycerol transferase MdoB-like AlkP superfamily enzyme